MANPIVHFEIIGTLPAELRRYYGALFGWSFDTSSPVAKEISEAGNYGFVDKTTTPDGTGVPGGVGGGKSHDPHVVFYVGVDDVAAALEQAEHLGGRRVMGPVKNPERKLVVAHFADPEGNVIGLAGPT